MNFLYPIIRRVRRPLVPVEITSPPIPALPVAPASPVGPSAEPPPAPAAPVGERPVCDAEACPELLPDAGMETKPKRRDTREKIPSK